MNILKDKLTGTENFINVDSLKDFCLKYRNSGTIISCRTYCSIICAKQLLIHPLSRVPKYEIYFDMPGSTHSNCECPVKLAVWSDQLYSTALEHINAHVYLCNIRFRLFNNVLTFVEVPGSTILLHAISDVR